MKVTFQDGPYETYSDKCKIYVNHKPMFYCVSVNSDNTKDLSLDKEVRPGSSSNQEIGHNFHIMVPLFPLRHMTALGKCIPLRFRDELEERLHTLVLCFVVATVQN